jgi:hypothetical protein
MHIGVAPFNPAEHRDVHLNAVARALALVLRPNLRIFILVLDQCAAQLAAHIVHKLSLGAEFPAGKSNFVS